MRLFLLLLLVVVLGVGSAQAAASSIPDGDPNQPLTVVITRVAKPGCTAALGQVLRAVVDEQMTVPGHISTDILPPVDAARDRRFQAIVKFSDRAAWQRWLERVKADGLFDRMNALTEGKPDFRYLTGLETWFTPPASEPVRQPPRWKQATVVWLALFPLVVAVPAILGPALQGLPGVLRTVVTTGTIVPIMTYFAVPRVSDWLDPWLYPRPPGCLG